MDSLRRLLQVRMPNCAKGAADSGTAARSPLMQILEPVHDLLSNSAKKAKWMNCRLVLSLRSQFFHSFRFFSSQAKLRTHIIDLAGARK